MSGRPRNMDYAVQGGTVTLDAYFYDFSGGILTDPDSAPTYTVTDPNGVVMATGSGTKVSIGYYTASYTTTASAEVSDYWKIVWVAYVNESQVEDSWEYFRVVTSGSIYLGTVVISTDTLNLIKKRVAYPSADQILLTDEEIKTYCVRQALDDYFIKFPLREEQSAEINGESVIDFPDTSTFGVLDTRIVEKGYARGSTGSFWDIIAYQSAGGAISSRNATMYGAKVRGYNPSGVRQSRMMTQIANDSLINKGTYKYRVDIENRKLYAYSSISATLNITWAKRSLVFDNVKFQFEWDVIKLSQAYLMRHIADTVGIITDSAQEVMINHDMLREQADKILEEIKEKWNEYSDMIVIRQ